MVEALVLAYPHDSKEYVLDTDASTDGSGVVRLQCLEEQERVVAYVSKTFGAWQCNYCVTRWELLAVVLVVNHFRS